MKQADAFYLLHRLLLVLLLVDSAIAFHAPPLFFRGDAVASLAMMADHSPTAPIINVAMTREDGKNGKLQKALEKDEEAAQLQINAMELPCIAHADGPDLDNLRQSLTEQSWDYVAVTSPEAARVLIRGIQGDTQLLQSIAVAAVGKATEKQLKDNNLNVAFTPSKAYAKNLVAELPATTGATTRVLYPASCRAPGTLADGLTQQRGEQFEVVRLNTYDTVTAEWTDEQRTAAQSCHIACFASPSSVKGWLKNYYNDNCDETQTPPPVLAACIGQTSATACEELGWDREHIFFPDSPGIEGWVDAIKRAAKSLNTAGVAS
mmetsp:Transcript_26018/g.71663  ORF Transcript_26018/g.71663 Transcript_26018/m.71663 type:complete len:320 (+) Transcript_26018:67-1026(+)